MHLFAVAHGLTADETERLRREVRRTASLFPQLDHDVLQESQPLPEIFAGGVATPMAVAAPREYWHEADGEVVLYDGLPIDPSGTFEAHRASVLGAHWDHLSSRLEGRFAILRVRATPRTIELLTDPIGIGQVYVYERPGASIVSNSAGLIARCLRDRGLDPLGASTFLVLDWVAGDRTLRPAVQVVPGAQHWTWASGDATWTKRRYWSYADADPPTRRVDDTFVTEVASSIGRFCAVAATVNGSVNAPLTGGKDSRMLAAILMTSGVPARYWTQGVPESLDVQIAVQLAARYGLPHRVSARPTQDPGTTPPGVAENWGRLSREFLAQNDGLPSLFYIGNLYGQPDRVPRLAVTLNAICAEVARRARAQLYLDAPGASLSRAVRYLSYEWAHPPRGLVRQAAYALGRQQIADTIRRYADDGVPLTNLSAVFYVDERGRRWASNNPRELAQTEDKVLPFMTRSFVMPVLSTDPGERATHQIHRRIIDQLVPGMDVDVPLAEPWFTSAPVPQRREMAIKGVMSRLPYSVERAQLALRDRLRPPQPEWETWTPFDELSWLDANLGWAREVASSRDDGPVWDYLDRRLFKRLLDERTDQRERRVHQLPLFAGLTMLAYDELDRGLPPA